METEMEMEMEMEMEKKGKVGNEHGCMILCDIDQYSGMFKDLLEISLFHTVVISELT